MKCIAFAVGAAAAVFLVLAWRGYRDYEDWLEEQ